MVRSASQVGKLRLVQRHGKKLPDKSKEQDMSPSGHPSRVRRAVCPSWLISPSERVIPPFGTAACCGVHGGWRRWFFLLGFCGNRGGKKDHQLICFDLFASASHRSQAFLLIPGSQPTRGPSSARREQPLLQMGALQLPAEPGGREMMPLATRA